MDKDKYVEALRQLENPENDHKLSLNPMGNTQETLRGMLSTAKQAGWITKQEHDFLWCEHPGTPTFYMLLKVHKNLESPLGRPIMSSNGSLQSLSLNF